MSECRNSGGIGALNDLQNLKKTKVQNVIVGRALYENKFSLNEALVLHTLNKQIQNVV